MQNKRDEIRMKVEEAKHDLKKGMSLLENLCFEPLADFELEDLENYLKEVCCAAADFEGMCEELHYNHCEDQFDEFKKSNPTYTPTKDPTALLKQVEELQPAQKKAPVCTWIVDTKNDTMTPMDTARLRITSGEKHCED